MASYQQQEFSQRDTLAACAPFVGAGEGRQLYIAGYLFPGERFAEVASLQFRTNRVCAMLYPRNCQLAKGA